MRAVEVLLLAFDHAWEHKWEALLGALKGVGPEEAAWQSPAYADAEKEEGWPLPGTVHWQVAHLAHCKRYYTVVVAQRGQSGTPETPPRLPNQSFEQEIVELHAAHAEQRAGLAALADADLDARVGSGKSLAEFVAACTRHDAWHAAQVAVARRLYRTRA